MGKARLVLIVVLVVLCLVIILQNTDTVTTRVLFATITMPLSFLLFLTALLGFLAGLLASALWLRRNRRAK